MRLRPVPPAKNPCPPLKGALFVFALGSLGLIALSPVVGQGLIQNSVPHLPPEMNRIPDGNRINDINESPARQQRFEAVNAARMKQMAEDAARLAKLAADLKIEVDEANKDTLSINSIRKADEIEKLARNVKEKMRLTVGSS
jgi:hypothetical protein